MSIDSQRRIPEEVNTDTERKLVTIKILQKNYLAVFQVRKL